MNTSRLRTVALVCMVVAVLAGMAIPAVRGEDTQTIELLLAGLIVVCALTAGASLVLIRRRERE